MKCKYNQYAAKISTHFQETTEKARKKSLNRHFKEGTYKRKIVLGKFRGTDVSCLPLQFTIREEQEHTPGHPNQKENKEK